MSSLDLSPNVRRRKAKRQGNDRSIAKSVALVTLSLNSAIPGEIRNLIWELCTPRRLVKASHRRFQYSSHPSTFSINRESRSIALFQYHQIERNEKGIVSGHSPKTLFFNPDNDLLCIGPMCYQEDSPIHKELLKKAKYVYITIDSLRSQSTAPHPNTVIFNTAIQNPFCSDKSGPFPRLAGFKNLERVFVVLTGKNKHTWDRKKHRNGTLNGYIEWRFKKLWARNPNWEIPLFTAVEEENNLLKIWESWSA
ncbi:hypothetical protein BDZ45DRAFT_809921 [Acephala macrosclerotiorum]|nr:hypothetical protein BDZ45DRAFT_809921 [Acephala macrosclerotiorum]